MGEIVLNRFFSLLQRKEHGLCVLNKGGGLEGLFKLLLEAGKRHSVDAPCCDHKVGEPSSCIISFHVGENDQHLLLISWICFEDA